MQHEFDVAVVGAGPAGAACALRLAREGYCVALIDACEFPRHKLCGEYLNAGAVRELRDLGVYEELAPSALLLSGMRLHAHGDSADFAFACEAWSMPRILLDDRLRRRAIDAGAVPRSGRVRAIRDYGTHVELELNEGGDTARVRSRYVAAADGMRSTIARLAGLCAGHRATRFAVGGHYGGGRFSRWIEMYAASDGYLAINPLDSTSANTVFVLDRAHLHRHRQNLPEELERFSRAVSRGRRKFSEDQLQEGRRAAGPLAHAVHAVTRGNIVLVGDAAGFVDPFTGQGVFLALKGAKLAASAISEAFARQGAGTQPFERYERELRLVVADRKRLAWLIRSILMSPFLSRRAANAIRRRPGEYRALIDAVCGATALRAGPLAIGIARALR